MHWSFDNSQLLTVGLDGALCIWDTESGSCIRSLAMRGVSLHCCRFHCINPNLALVGTSTGWLEVFNCSTGRLNNCLTAFYSFHHFLPNNSSSAIINGQNVSLGGLRTTDLFYCHRCIVSKISSCKYFPMGSSGHRYIWRKKLWKWQTHHSIPYHQAHFTFKSSVNYGIPEFWQWKNVLLFLLFAAIEVSNHHVFVGDSVGFVHLYR